MTMKTMGVGVFCAALSIGASAQSQNPMPADHHMDHMDHMDHTAATTVTYSGCIETENAVPMYILTHVTAGAPMASKDGAMKDGAMKDDAMKHDAMKHDAMKDDAMKHDAMKSGEMKKGEMSSTETMGAMVPSTITLRSTSVILEKHLGHTVTLTGTLVDEPASSGKPAVPILQVTKLTMMTPGCR